MSEKLLVFTFTALLIIFISINQVNAENISELENSVSQLIGGLSVEVKKDLEQINVTSPDLNQLNNLSFEDIIDLIFSKINKTSAVPFAALSIVISVLILNAIFDSYTDALRESSTKEVFSIVSTLTITTTLVVPIIDLINDSIATVSDASDFMLLYIPVMVAILTFSGQAISGASYYSLMVMACQGVSQISTKVVSPMLSVYLGLCVSSSLTSRINLSGLCQMFSKIIKWLISFSMTIFTALLTIRGMITTAYDSVTTRAVRFTMSSFIPIVGTALAESYKTIQGSINLLRTGAGVFVILAIFVVFLPCVCRCVVWLFAINICKTFAQLIGVTTQVNLLSSVSSVISTVFAITVCIMAVFIISTALLITLGGGG